VTAPQETKIHIRPATADDNAFVLSLVPRLVAFELPKGRHKCACTAAIRADVARGLRNPSADDCFFIAEGPRGARTGFLRLQVQRDFFSGVRACHISDLVVANGHDGRGIGRALLDHAQKWAKANRCKLLTLAVFPGNARARALYERAGFTVELLRMAKPLQGTRR